VKRGRGRPRANPDDARSVLLCIRLTPEERDRVRAASERAGNATDSEWARDVLLATTEKALR
jgi:hypothetical protein